MKRLVFLTICLSFLSCDLFKAEADSGDTLHEKTWFVGQWEGNGYLKESDGAFKVVVNAGDGSTISVKYPNQGCGGTWETLKTKSKKMQFSEKITYGEACLEGSEIELTQIDEKKVLVKYYNDLVSKELLASATILKTGR